MQLGTGLVSWELIFTKQAQKDAKNPASDVKEKALQLLEIVKNDPYQNPPAYVKLVGDLSGAYSRRINILYRLVYQVLESERQMKILRMWRHYEEVPVQRLWLRRNFSTQ